MLTKVRLGIIGVSGRGGMARYWYEDERVKIVAGADISEEKLHDFRKKYNGPFITTDYKKLLKRNDIDAVAIMSPDFAHEEQAVAALDAGKHVFCEKPLAITVKGCDKIIKAWEDSGKKLMVGFNMRYMHMFQTMKDIVESGAIGKIKAVWVRHFVGRGGEFYYHDWHGTRENTTSLLLQKGSHDIDIIHWITGKYAKKASGFGGLDYYGGDKANDLNCPDCPEKEKCNDSAAEGDHKDQCSFRKEIDVEDNQVVIFELDGGIKASYLQCHFTPDYHRNYTFIGTEGRLENSEPEGKVWVTTRKSGKRKDYSNRTYHIKGLQGTHGGADPKICKDFIDMIIKDKEPIADPWSGRMSVAAGIAATKSIRNGGRVIEVE